MASEVPVTSSAKQPRLEGGAIKGLWPLGAIVIVVVVAPQIATIGTLFLLESILIWILFATSTNFLFGRSYLPSLGQAAFLGTGAYTVALLHEHVSVTVALILAMVFAGAISALVAAVSIRTRGIVFANVTLALGQGLYLVAFQTDLVGGSNGIPGIFPEKLSLVGTWYLTGGVVTVAVAVCWVVYHSPFGFTLRALREDPVRLQFLGVNVALYKFTAFTLAGAGAGLAGGLFAYTSGIVTPNIMYWTHSGYPILMILIGGMGFFWGPAVGAICITILLNELAGYAGWNLVILGLVFIVVLRFAPQGLLGWASAIGRRLTGLIRHPGGNTHE